MADAEIVPLSLSADRALRLIRELATDSSNIIVVNHGRVRQRERRITTGQIVGCVRLGTISEGPFRNQFGNWQVTLYRHAAGEELSCVVAIDWAKKLIVITAF